ncbi:hypothetical protein LCL97_17300 [Seohaeicola saemankumensis]|nr:hypothetical protein [Seohaeicola saemankumensis]MCA0872593.1 hypothetical protein [Seohaeicola saemankumensis]
MSLTLPTIVVTLSALTLAPVAPVPSAPGFPLNPERGGSGYSFDRYDAGGDSIGTVPTFIPPAAKPGGSSTPGTTTPTPAQTTTAVVNTLNSATRYCAAIKQTTYAIDCLAERLDNVNRRMAGVEGYEEVRAALNEASRGLNRIARENRSATEPPAIFEQRKSDGSKVRTSRPLVPVDAARLDSAVAQALAVIEDTETVLLRSAESSAERAAQFQRIAQAVGSNKVLLRSL